MVRKHGKEPYHIVVLHGGSGAAGSAFGLARLISKEFGVLKPMQSKYTIMEQEEELSVQIEKHCSGKVILIGYGPLEEYYVSQIGERRKENMSPGEEEKLRFQVIREQDEDYLMALEFQE